MKALWLVPPVVTESIGRINPEYYLTQCPMASARMRIAPAASSLKEAGHKNLFRDPAKGKIDWSHIDVCVVSKFYHDNPLKPWLQTTLDAKKNGVPLVMDICDYPFDKPSPVPEYYTRTLPIVELITANSTRMQALLDVKLTRNVVLVEDAIIELPYPVAFAPGNKLKLCWFGHLSNLNFLGQFMVKLAQFAAQRPCELTVVTLPGYEQQLEVIRKETGSTFELRYVPWSLEAQRRALRDCDIVVLPHQPEGTWKIGASANRLAEGINAGRFVVASPIESYLPFKDCAWLGDDLIEGIVWALGHSEEVLARIEQGQKEIARFRSGPIGQQWRELLLSLCAR